VTRKIPVRDFARVAAGLKAPLGVHAVLGNHDWWDDRTAQRLGHGPIISARELAEVGIGVLENGATRLVQDGRPFWLLGLGDQIALLRRPRIRGVDDLPGTLARITDDAPAILLAHEPDIFPKVPARVALTLSGHTHGGQVRLFGYSPVTASRFGNRYAYGHVREGGRDLVVSGGLGTSILPVRFGVPPEIVLIELGDRAAST
jgi:predicted MPP superfamily phosphohydrolase